MPKDLDFHIPVIDVMFKLTFWVTSTTAAANFPINYTATKLG